MIDKVDPVSGAGTPVVHTPGENAAPEDSSPRNPSSKANSSGVKRSVVMEPSPELANTTMNHSVIAPVASVAKEKLPPELRLVSVCTPSVNVNRVGKTPPLKFGARGPANVTIPVTKSLVV